MPNSQAIGLTATSPIRSPRETLCTPDQSHAWAYLPDAANEMVGLAEIRSSLPKFDTFGFEGYTLTDNQLTEEVEEATARHLKRRGMPWFMIPFFGLFSPTIKKSTKCETFGMYHIRWMPPNYAQLSHR